MLAIIQRFTHKNLNSTIELFPSSLSSPNCLTKSQNIIICPICSKNCQKFEKKLHKTLPNEKPLFICSPCKEALYKRYPNPKYPICLRPCLEFTITYHFICYSCGKIRRHLALTKNEHFQNHEEIFCRSCTNTSNKCLLCNIKTN